MYRSPSMSTKRILLRIFILFIIWLFLFFTPKARSEAPVVIHEIPQFVSADPIQEYAYQQIASTWGAESWDDFYKLIHAESEWKPYAQNPNSTAYGLGQFLDSTWTDLELQKTSDPKGQIDATILYIQKRYHSPARAWEHWIHNRWY